MFKIISRSQDKFKIAFDTRPTKPIQRCYGLRPAGVNWEIDITSLARICIEQKINHQYPEVDHAVEQDALTQRSWIDKARATLPVKLMPFQERFLGFAFSRFSPPTAVLNACEPGLGKTLMLLCTVLVEDPNAPLLILCPLSAMGSFEKELRRLNYTKPILRVKKKDLDLGFDGAQVLSYDSLPPISVEASRERPLEDYAATMHPDLRIVADEFHLLKSNKAKRTLRFRGLVSLYRKRTKKNRKILAATGTPLLNTYKDLWCLATNLKIHKDVFGDYLGFLDLAGGYKGRFGVEFGRPRDPALLQAVLRRAIYRVTKAEVVEQMPVEVETVINTSIDRTTYRKLQAIYDELQDLDALESEEIVIDRMSGLKRDLAITKIPTLLDLVETYEAADESLVVMSDHVAVVRAFEDRHGWRVIDGSVEASERQEIADQLNRGELLGVAATYGAGGTGLSMSGASTMVLCDLNYTKALVNQAKKRIDRIDNQSPKLHYIYLQVDHPMEAVIHNVLARKTQDALDSGLGS